MAQKGKQILVLGVGNILLGDEGAGIKAVELMQERYDFGDNVEFLDGGAADFELAAFLTNKTDLFIFDAIVDDARPGTVKRFNRDNPPAFFGDEIGLSAMLGSASPTDNFPANITMFGIVPKSVDTGMELTGPVREGVEQMVDMAIDDLETIGAVL